MNKKYIIRWKSKVNGRTGQGTKVFGRDEAEQLVAELNQGYPDIEHEVIETNNQTTGRLLQPGSEPIDTDKESSRPAEPSSVLSFQE